jgi:hypothetical protein
MASSRAFVKATTTHVREGVRGACPGGDVHTTVVTNIVTIDGVEARQVETVTYVSPTPPVGSYYGQCVGRSWTPVFLG